MVPWYYRGTAALFSDDVNQYNVVHDTFCYRDTAVAYRGFTAWN